MNKYYAALKKAELSAQHYSADLAGSIMDNFAIMLTNARNWYAGNKYLGDTLNDMSKYCQPLNNKQRISNITFTTF